uniref:Uncharacterized protein n=1 Tax=Globodera rostochiensis TaxID=31243 RepID=A0A914I7J0_GLORO
MDGHIQQIRDAIGWNGTNNYAGFLTSAWHSRLRCSQRSHRRPFFCTFCWWLASNLNTHPHYPSGVVTCPPVHLMKKHTATNNMAICILVFILLSVAANVSKNELVDVEEPYAELNELRQKLQQMESENHECRAKYAAVRQRTRSARSMSEHADTCNGSRLRSGNTLCGTFLTEESGTGL